MKKHSIISLYILFIANTFTLGQVTKLKPVKHGLDLILSARVSKEEIIEDVKFADEKVEYLDIVRFDMVGTGAGVVPLIISSESRSW